MISNIGHSRRTWRRPAAYTATAVAAALVAATLTGTQAAAASPAPAAAALPSVAPAAGTARPTASGGGLPGQLGGSVHYAKAESVCSAPVAFGQAQCMGVKLVPAARTTPGAVAYKVPTGQGLRGPASGFSPTALADAYGYNPKTPRPKQTVAIIDAFSNPKARFDLDSFDKHYGLPQETARSLRIVNQRGGTKLPKANKDWSLEIATDLEAVRGVCNTCRILLVEAHSATQGNLGAAVDRAARMGATEISNSYGAPEQHPGAARYRKVYRRWARAYNHPGVLVTASAGDNGWDDWDRANATGGRSGNAAAFPATAPGVLSVGGTHLVLNAKGQRLSETVWNNHGHEDLNAYAASPKLATGGGCSKIFAAPAWQKSLRAYRATRCGGMKSVADVAALADPYTGYDIFDRTNGGWLTTGGTSLAAPLIAAMAALSGGSHNALHPQATPYANARAFGKKARWDVTDTHRIAGGNGFCGGDFARHCGNVVFKKYTGGGIKTHNPNALGFGLLDCSFRARGNKNAAGSSTQCNAAPGFDGPTGVGTPRTLRLFDQSNPALHTLLPAARLHTAQRYIIRAHAKVAGAKVVSYLWKFGDHTISHRRVARHAYARPGTYHVTVEATDTFHQTTVRHLVVRVGLKAKVHVVAPRVAHPRVVRTFSARGSRDVNTGGRIVRIVWHFGDGHSKAGWVAQHAYAHPGRYRVVLKLKDTAGVVTKYVFRVRVLKRA